MDEALIKNWNKIVSPSDIIYHLGDFAFLNYEQLKQLLPRLNGHIKLILGNHDQVIVKHQKEFLELNYFDTIEHYHELKYNKKQYVLFHFPMRSWNKMYRNSIHAHGHVHGNIPPFGLSVDVGVDCKEITSEYRPISIDELEHYMSLRQFEPHK